MDPERRLRANFCVMFCPLEERSLSSCAEQLPCERREAVVDHPLALAGLGLKLAGGVRLGSAITILTIAIIAVHNHNKQ